MFPYLPIELEMMIWENYRVMFLFPEIRTRTSIWSEPSDKLFEITRDVGAIQVNCTDFERLLSEGHMKWYCENLQYQPCLLKLCINCFKYGFPCKNVMHIGNLNNRMLQHRFR